MVLVYKEIKRVVYQHRNPHNSQGFSHWVKFSRLSSFAHPKRSSFTQGFPHKSGISRTVC